MTISRRTLFPVAILLAGVLVTVAMIIFKPKVSRTHPPRPAATVEVVEARSESLPAVIRATGVVSSAQEVTLIPEVSGSIRFVSEKLVPGERFNKGELLAKIDSRDYSLAVRRAKSQVRQEELDLQLEQSRQETAKQEWELLGDSRPESEAALALRKPHLVAAEQSLAAAQSSLDQANINLGRTALRAPFNCLLLDENIDVGQVVGPSSVIAVLAGTDRFRIQASLRVDRLGLIDIPGFNSQVSSPVTIIQDMGGGKKAVREGIVVKLGGKLDPQTRTAQLLVALDDPLDPPAGAMPILNGAYVDIEIKGRIVPDVVVVPRSALVEGTKVWLVDASSKLVSRIVDIGWGNEQSVMVTNGLAAGEQIVVTPLAIPVEGMPVRIANDQEGSEVSTDTEVGDAS